MMITDDQKFQTLLNFLHDKRILIHFNDTPELDKWLVLDPQWLIDVFRMVITVRPYNPKRGNLKHFGISLRMMESWRKNFKACLGPSIW